MIIDLPRFIEQEKPYWNELEQWLERLETNPERALGLKQVERLHYLYERAASDLAGMRIRKRVPRPGRLVQVMVPPSACVTLL